MSTDVMSIPTGTSSSEDLNDPRLGNEGELRELVYQALERDGLISRLKAQLRAAVFTAIEKAANSNGTNSHTPVIDGPHGRICRALVQDWLEHSRLLYTEDVFRVETTGPNQPAPLNRHELFEQLQIKSNQNSSQPILHALIEHGSSSRVATPVSPSTNSLPDHIKQSIDNKFPTEKINHLSDLHDHFRALFSSAFPSSVLDAYLNQMIPSSSTSLPKYTYEDICLKWIQACSNALSPQSIPSKQTSSTMPIQSIVTTNTVINAQKLTQARRAATPPNESSSSSSSSSSSAEEQPKRAFDFPLPTTINTNKSVIKKSTDLLPPPLIDFDHSDSNEEQEAEEEEEEDTSASILSKRNATPAALQHLKTIDSIIQGDETPRTRTTLQKSATNGTRDLPIEYDDESMSQSISHSIISSVDDVTVDKASPSPSATLDFFDDL